MKIYTKAEQFPSPDQLANWQSLLQSLKQELQSYAVSLSLEERQGKRKMGPRRVAYAQSAERRGVLHEEVMSRTFYAANFTRIISVHNEFSRMLAQVGDLQELLDDTLMAIGIDAMTYTKVVHDGLRGANILNPAMDAALRELDDFNKRAQAEEVEESTTTE